MWARLYRSSTIDNYAFRVTVTEVVSGHSLFDIPRSSVQQTEASAKPKGRDVRMANSQSFPESESEVRVWGIVCPAPGGGKEAGEPRARGSGLFSL